MADGKAFLLPVVIDSTLDANASVPEKFREVQWTHLPAGEASVAFAGRLQQFCLYYSVSWGMAIRDWSH